MKIIILTITLFLATFSNLFSQTLNGIPVKDLQVDYIEIMGVQSGFSSRVKITVDYGQKLNITSKNEERFIMGPDGKVLKFDSMMDAINFFSENGFEYVNSYAYAVGNSTVYHHLLRKKAAKL